MKYHTIAITNITEKLGSVSPTMCLAKWMQSTIYLNSGSTHSCHHPGVHQIPVEGLDTNPGMIHNTPFKLGIRQQMLDGIRPPECDYCWRIEDLPGALVSDRITKSASPYAAPFFDDVIKSGVGPNTAPTYLEVSFESTCNFSCVYCLPEVSSKIYAEIAQHGPYKLSNGHTHNTIGGDRSDTKIMMQKADDNPYVAAFWKVLPEWWPTLDTFRITGGEPLLSKHTWTMMEFVKKNANKKLSFAINSNLGVPSDKIDLLIDWANDITPNLASFRVFTSVEATGPQAEYIRHGMDYAAYVANIRKILEQTKASVALMTTINCLSYSTFVDCLKVFTDLRAEFPKRVVLSFNYLRHPSCLDAQYLPPELKKVWIDQLTEVTRNAKNNIGPMFHEIEIDQLTRFIEYLAVVPSPEKYSTNQQDLALYTKQIDARRGLDFAKTFPALAALLPAVE